MDAVRDVSDGNVVLGPVRPKALPHGPRNAAVKLADAIGGAGAFEGQDGHAEGLVGIIGTDPSERQDLGTGDFEPFWMREVTYFTRSG